MKLEMEEKPELKILKHIQSDVSLMKQKILIMEEEVEAISEDMHEVRPEYVKKIQEIEKRGSFHSFKNVDEMRRAIEA